jgi:uncharacterized protein (TIGR03382 family)
MRGSTTRLPAVAVILAPALVAAHVRITSPTQRSDALKQRHCGATGSARANVQTMRPGSVMHLVWDEYVPHPGWYRISFQQNGDTFEIPPASTGPSSLGASNYPTEDLTGQTDPISGSRIIADRIQHPTLSMDVTLPDVECNNCTLQLIQMMIDKPDYSIAVGSDDIYFACVDLVLSATAPDAGPGGGGGVDGPPDAGIGLSAGNVSGGCSATGGSPGILALAIAGLVLRRRRAARRPMTA